MLNEDSGMQAPNYDNRQFSDFLDQEIHTSRYPETETIQGLQVSRLKIIQSLLGDCTEFKMSRDSKAAFAESFLVKRLAQVFFEDSEFGETAVKAVLNAIAKNKKKVF